ncbi:hypothetical protein [Lysinibacillus sp. K60]|uniref:hypothetical protein n=1 Tax=Lysinibacillus sp. K60 TaxID=2720027 RepID=UPI001C8C3FFF|nr:hypothetical protein [Lysinibacillus sp. K60]MBX8945877.1 hypothetical protein [Lysinibacillus sp. K60]
MSDNSNQVYVKIFLFKEKKDEFVQLYNTMQYTYNRTMELVYSNIDDRYYDYKHEEYEKLMAKSHGMDLADIDYSEYESEAAFRIERDYLMKYQFHFSSLVNLYQVFEQQIRKLLYSELNHRLSLVRTKDKMPSFATTFGGIKDVLKALNYQTGVVKSWPLIDELNKIANVYKHGDGNSAKRLYRSNKELFVDLTNALFYFQTPKNKIEEEEYFNSLNPEEQQEFKERKEILLIKEELTTNSEIVLREDLTEYSKYVKAIIDFWSEFPECYSTIVRISNQ